MTIELAVALAAAAAAAGSLALCAWLWVRVRRLRNAQRVLLGGGRADLVDDGGPGDDTLAPMAPIAVTCGEGHDLMAGPDWTAESPAPGPLFGLDCEGSEALPMRPAVAGGVATFTWSCPSYWRTDPCTRPITLRWNGAVAAAGRFVRRADGTGVARLPLSPALRAGLATGPVEVALTMPDVESESSLDLVITKWVRWRVVLQRPRASTEAAGRLSQGG